jgi:hypothetical protein
MQSCEVLIPQMPGNATYRELARRYFLERDFGIASGSTIVNVHFAYSHLCLVRCQRYARRTFSPYRVTSF